ncbi:MAG: phosphoglycerate dehydrogenase [Planctomycetes bacterium]|nr:phosphoglycerate dehydrogenase [Planctomycetota bacterium]
MKKILVTPRSVSKNGHPALKRLSDAGYEVVFATPGVQPAEDELLKTLPGCVGMLAGVEKISARVLEAAAGLKAISRNGTGVDAIDLAKAKELGIRVLRAEGANARGVAELAFGHILAAVRSITASDAAMKQGKWERRKGIELEGRTIGLVGCGRIGRLVAGFALAFDMKVAAYDPYPDEAYRPGAGFRWSTMDELLEESDVISLHCPPPADGKPVIDAAAIGKMKQGVYLVNTARAALWDEKAVAAGLDSGRIAGATVDAFAEEPPGDWGFVSLPGVVATPHTGGYTEESVDRAVGAAVDNLLEALEG